MGNLDHGLLGFVLEMEETQGHLITLLHSLTGNYSWYDPLITLKTVPGVEVVK